MKRNDQEKLKKDRGLLWASLICVALCLVVLSVFLLSDPLSAWKQKREVLSVFSAEEIRMVVNDPLGDGQELFTGVTVMLDAEQMEAVAEDLKWAMEESRFREQQVTLTGVWLPSVTVASREESVKIFLGESALFLEKDGKSTTYEIREADLARYRELYNRISSYLDEARR